MCVHMHIHAYMCLQSLNSGEYPQTTSRAVLSKFIDLWQQFRCLVQSHLAIEHTSNHAPTHPHNMYMYLILGTAIFILFLIPILLPLLVSSQCSSPTTSSAQDRKSCVNMCMGVCVWMRMCTCDSHPPRSQLCLGRCLQPTANTHGLQEGGRCWGDGRVRTESADC